MTKHHHTGQPSDAGELLRAVEAFVATCRSPALLEFGDELLPLKPGEYALEVRAGRLWIDAWDEQRSVSRRILAVEAARAGMLDCLIHRFAGQPGKLTFLDTDRPQTAHRKLAGARQSFAEQFRRMLTRQFPGWQAQTVTSSMDLQRSLSPVYPRARLTRGTQQIAAMACPEPDGEAGMLTFALIWFEHVKHFSERTQLCLFLPDGCGALTAQRLRWLDMDALRPRVFRFNEHGSAGEVDPQDLGNIDTRVSPRFQSVEPDERMLSLLAELAVVEGVGVCPDLNGELSVRSRGVEFARIRASGAWLGIEELRPAEHYEIVAFAGHLNTLPIVPAEERWLESVIRQDPRRIYPTLHKELLHSQVLTFAGTDRDMLDLLGVTGEGRLAVLELKAQEDIQLPMQALDYWMRVRWHAERGELAHLFPGVALRSDSPLLFLVAPALAFHPAVQTVLRYFSPAIHVERVGVNSNWRDGLRVVMRLNGADSPQSQIKHEHHYGHSEHQEGDLDAES